jgi:hypothetical protein
MDPQIAKTGLAIGLFVIVAALLILPWQAPGSAEYVVTVMALAVGIVTVVVVALVIRKLSR